MNCLKRYASLAIATFLSLNANLVYAVCSCSTSYAGQYVVSTNNLPLALRNGHSSSYAKIGTLPKGAVVNVTAANGNWAHVTYNGKNGYASMQYLQKIASPNKPNTDPVTKNVLKGDVNGDGRVNTTDLTQLQLYIAKKISSLARMDNADINGDGTISVTDLARLNLHLGGIEPFDSNGKPINKTEVLKVVYPADGFYSLHPKCAENLALTASGTALGANVNVSTNKSIATATKSNQRWKFTRINNSEWYKIEAENSGLALNVHNGIGANGTNVSLWPKDGDMQLFRFCSSGNGYHVLQAKVNGAFVLDVKNGSGTSGSNVQIYSSSANNAAQQWKLVKQKNSYEINTEYVCVQLGDFKTAEEWIEQVKQAEQLVTGLPIIKYYNLNQKATNFGKMIVDKTVLQRKAISVKYSNMGKIIEKKIELPSRIYFKLHKHDMKQQVIYGALNLKLQQYCSCGEQSTFQWDLPLPEPEFMDAISNAKTIKNTPVTHTTSLIIK